MSIAKTPSPWVVIPRSDGRARLRLFCFPYAGGGARTFHPWARMLPSGVELCAVQPPGRENRLSEAPYTNMLELVDRLAEVLAPWMDVPFAFFGHSNGAIMSFELARRLRRAGRPLPLHLFLSGRQAPHLPPRHEPIHALAEPAFSERLRRLEGTPEEILQNDEIMELVRPLLRADFALAETYAYAAEPPLAIPISAYGGDEDPDVFVDDVHAWREYTSAAFHARIFPGGHFFLHSGRAAVLEELSREIARL
ncbi:MAG TPA: thioesterase domain-containing protein [Longimicrobiaceae bacterium]|nr:thioesterase domain-containing protein [Longimicrobiaceae bacterium]